MKICTIITPPPPPPTLTSSSYRALEQFTVDSVQCPLMYDLILSILFQWSMQVVSVKTWKSRFTNAQNRTYLDFHLLQTTSVNSILAGEFLLFWTPSPWSELLFLYSDFKSTHMEMINKLKGNMTWLKDVNTLKKEETVLKLIRSVLILNSPQKGPEKKF